LHRQKDTIEQEFGDQLEWLPEDKAKMCLIRYVLLGGGLRNQDRWEELQDQMIDAMVRLERALRPHIKRL
jgi:hypothetical protein